MDGALGIDCGADDAQVVFWRNQFDAASLQRAHLHHLMNQTVEYPDVNPFGIWSGQIERSWPFHVNARSRGGSQRAVAAVDELPAALVASYRVRKNLLRLQIEKAHTHS